MNDFEKGFIIDEHQLVTHSFERYVSIVKLDARYYGSRMRHMMQLLAMDILPSLELINITIEKFIGGSVIDIARCDTGYWIKVLDQTSKFLLVQDNKLVISNSPFICH